DRRSTFDDLKFHRPGPYLAARFAVTPAHDSAVGQSFHVLNLSAVGAGNRMRQVSRSPAAARNHSAVGPVRVAAIGGGIVHSSTSTFALRATADSLRVSAGLPAEARLRIEASLPSRSPPWHRHRNKLACQAVAPLINASAGRRLG